MVGLILDNPKPKGTDPHYCHKEDTCSPVESGPKAPCMLTVRSWTPLCGDEKELNEVGSVPHDDSPDERYKHGTEFPAMTLYHEMFSHSVDYHGGRMNCKSTGPHENHACMTPMCH